MKARWLPVAMALPPLCGVAGAASICRWVDQQGRTQRADVVADKHEKLATCTDSRKHELSIEQRRAAEQSAADDRPRARQSAAKPAAPAAPDSLHSARAASGPGAKRPLEVVTNATDCRTWWRIHDESVECFGRYRTTRGATRPE